MKKNNSIAPEHRLVSCITCHLECTIQNLERHIRVIHEGSIEPRFKNSKFNQLKEIPKETIVKIFQQTNSMQGILDVFNMARDPRKTEYIRSILREFKIEAKSSVKEDMLAREDEIISLVPHHSSISSLIQSLDIPTVRKGMYGEIKQILNKHDIKLQPVFVWTESLIFCVDSKYPRSSLSLQVKKSNWLEYNCSICSMIPVWNNKPLRLQIDHINGIGNDHRKENLRWVCPNCHSQTETFCKSHRKG